MSSSPSPLSPICAILVATTLQPAWIKAQAEIESQLALGKLKPGRFGTPLGVPNDQDKVILSRAQWELNDKCSKQLADAITIPARHKFARIYFGFHALFDGKGFTVLRRF